MQLETNHEIQGILELLAGLLASGQHPCSAYAFLISWGCLWLILWVTKDILGQRDTSYIIQRVDYICTYGKTFVPSLGHMERHCNWTYGKTL